MRGNVAFRAIAVALGTLALVAAACAPSNPSAQGSVQPPPKQEVTIVQSADADTLDGQRTAANPAVNIIRSFSETLTKTSYSAQGEPKLEGLLAVSWNMPNDTTWQFKLRGGVKFSNGEPFDASAVKFSFERLMAPAFASPTKRYTDNVSKVEVVDPSTVNIVTKTPYPLAALDFNRVMMVPPKYTAEVGPATFALKPIGTGPFKFVEWVKDSHAIVEANPDYWGGRPKLNKITFKPVPEAATRSAAIQTGSADIVTQIGIADVAALQQKPGFKVIEAPGSRVMYIGLDQKSDPIMKDVRVRQALNYAVDKEAIINAVYQGKAKVLQGHGLTPAYFGFNPALKPYPYDVAKAKQLLTEAGHPNGFAMTIWTPRGGYLGDVETAQAVAGQLAKIGVRAEVKVLEYTVYLTDWAAKKLTPSFLTAIASNEDASTMFEHFRDGSVRSMGSYPEFTALVAKDRSTLDPQKRLPLLQQMAQMENEQAFAIWLHSLANIIAVSDRVQGFQLYPNEYFYVDGISMK